MLSSASATMLLISTARLFFGTMQYVAKTIHITDAVDVPIVKRVMSSPCSFVSVIGETEVDIRVRSCEPFNVLKNETLPLVVVSCGVRVAVLLFLGQSLSTKIYSVSAQNSSEGFPVDL